MTHTPWNMSGNDPASVDVRPVSFLVFLFLVLLAFPGVLWAGNEPSSPSLFPSSSTHTAKDVEIETKIRQKLRQDAQLAPLNLGVHMSNGVAKLSGPIPSAELKQRAIKIVEHVDGVLLVHSRDLYISSSAQGRNRMSVLIQDDRPTQTRAASPHTPAVTSGAGGQPDSPLSELPPQKADPLVSSAGSSQQITLLAPEIASPPARIPEAGRLTGNLRPESSNVALAAAIDHLRQREARYQQIRTRVEGTTVYIVPGETAGEDAMTFAQAVRRLSGVRHVVMDSGSR